MNSSIDRHHAIRHKYNSKNTQKYIEILCIEAIRANQHHFTASDAILTADLNVVHTQNLFLNRTNFNIVHC